MSLGLVFKIQIKSKASNAFSKFFIGGLKTFFIILLHIMKHQWIDEKIGQSYL